VNPFIVRPAVKCWLRVETGGPVVTGQMTAFVRNLVVQPRPAKVGSPPN
jgi:hypothetical protein